jgi:hypothetical protein
VTPLTENSVVFFTVHLGPENTSSGRFHVAAFRKSPDVILPELEPRWRKFILDVWNYLLIICLTSKTHAQWRGWVQASVKFCWSFGRDDLLNFDLVDPCGITWWLLDLSSWLTESWFTTRLHHQSRMVVVYTICFCINNIAFSCRMYLHMQWLFVELTR